MDGQDGAAGIGLRVQRMGDLGQIVAFLAVKLGNFLEVFGNDPFAHDRARARSHGGDDVIIVHSDQSQESLGLGGYLDIGIIDTMKDLFVNFIGAVVFSILGFIYVKTRGKGKIASSFIPQVNMNEESTENKEKD